MKFLIRSGPMLALFAVLLCLCAPQAGAWGRDVYKVEGLEAERMAADAVTAKRQALDHLYKEALSRLFRRLARSGDVVRLPLPTRARAEALVASFNVTSEETGATRYAVKAVVNFDRDRVADERDLYARARLTCSEGHGAPGRRSRLKAVRRCLDVIAPRAEPIDRERAVAIGDRAARLVLVLGGDARRLERADAGALDRRARFAAHAPLELRRPRGRGLDRAASPVRPRTTGSTRASKRSRFPPARAAALDRSGCRRDEAGPAWAR